jgi:ribosome-binding factor A
MASRRFARKPPTGLCEQLQKEDGTDPRFDVKQPQGKVSNRKALQLCRQVERTLTIALEGDVLRDLTVELVLPAPDSSRLLVVLRYHGPAAVLTAEIHDALQASHTKLRGEVAADIHRRKTPDLTFEILRLAS